MQAPKSEINQKENQVVFHLNAKVYSLNSIYAAAYVFIDRTYVYLDGDPKKEIIVFLKGKKKLSKKQLADLRGGFLNEVFNALAREKISQENKKILEYIVGGAITAALDYGKTSASANSDNSDKSGMGDIEKEFAGLKRELRLE